MDLAVKTVENAELLQHNYLRADRTKQRGELDADYAASHHHQPLRNFFQTERAGTIHHRAAGHGLLQPGNRMHGGARTSGNYEVVGSNCLASHLDRLSVPHNTATIPHFHPVVLQKIGHAVDELLHYLIFAAEHSAPIYLYCTIYNHAKVSRVDNVLVHLRTAE